MSIKSYNRQVKESKSLLMLLYYLLISTSTRISLEISFLKIREVEITQGFRLPGLFLAQSQSHAYLCLTIKGANYSHITRVNFTHLGQVPNLWAFCILFDQNIFVDAQISGVMSQTNTALLAAAHSLCSWPLVLSSAYRTKMDKSPKVSGQTRGVGHGFAGYYMQL